MENLKRSHKKIELNIWRLEYDIENMISDLYPI